MDEFKLVSALTDKPVKITMTGPHMLAKVAYDEHYHDLGKMMHDLAKLLRHNFRMLIAAGCRHIQIDEPLFTMSEEDEVASAVDAINLAIEGTPADVHVSAHICQGNYAVGKEYDGQIGHRYFDTGRYKADLVCRSRCSSYLIEYDMTPTTEDCSATSSSASEPWTCKTPSREPGGDRCTDTGARMARARADHPDELCGFNHLSRHVAFGKLKAMTEAKRMLGG